MARYELRFVGVYDRDTGKVIVRHSPAWPEYQHWLADGHTPDPMPIVPPQPPSQAEVDAQAELERRRAIGHQLAAEADVQALRAMTPEQAESWADGIAGFADARRVIRTLAKVVALLARERIG